MLGSSRPNIQPQLLGILQPSLKLPMLASHVPNDDDDLLQKKGLGGNSNTKHLLKKVRPYQPGHLIEVVITDIHPVFGHMPIGPLIQVVGEGDGVLLKISHHRNAEVEGVEIAHVHYRRIPLVERVTFSNKQPGNFLIRCRHILW